VSTHLLGEFKLVKARHKWADFKDWKAGDEFKPALRLYQVAASFEILPDNAFPASDFCYVFQTRRKFSVAQLPCCVTWLQPANGWFLVQF